MPIRVSKDRINMDDKLLEQPVLKDYGETVVTANSGTSYTIDLTAGNVFNITLTGNCTFTFANPPASGTAGSFTLILKQDATGGRSVTWPVAVKWPSDTTPSLNTSPDYYDVFTLLTLDAGIVWFGASAGGVFVFSGYLDYGWFGGGYNGGNRSTVDRIDYSTDTATASVRGPLSLVRWGLAATGNSSYGWFSGGRDGVNRSTVDRIDYANDTATASGRGPLSLARSGLAATGTSSYGWFSGGYTGTVVFSSYGLFNGGGGYRSTVDRIDYANDTPTASVRGPLSLARSALAATGTTSYGWFGGGYNGTLRSLVDRIDYANDTPTASVRGSLTAARYAPGATGTSSYGWFGGGYGGGNRSTVDRIDYANDTPTASGRGPLSLARFGLAASGTASFVWFGGGYNAGYRSTVDRVEYSNDTATASSRGPLSQARFALAATQNCPLK